jgi:hypothetical protein
MVNKEILLEIKKTLEHCSTNVPMDQYITLAKEYKKVCVNFERLLEKERERNHKFINVKRELLEAHSEDIKEIKQERDSFKRELEGCKKGIKSSSTSDSSKKGSEDEVILQDDIQGIISSKFSEESLRDMIREIVKHLSETTFDFNKISVSFFDENKIILLQRSIYKSILPIIESESSSTLSAITNTILRDYYVFSHEEFAKRVLEASDITRGVFKFFETHFIEVAESKARWNSFAITRFMHEYSESTTHLHKLEEKLSNAIKLKEEFVLTAEDELEMDIDEYNSKSEDRKKLEKLILTYKAKISAEEDKLGDTQKTYQTLLEGVTKFLLQKRSVIRANS